jgi:DNA (cytosine-5)-methyltransferase 1
MFPPRTHTLKVPRGYWTGRLANGDIPALPPHAHYIKDVGEIINTAPALNAAQAISDLPPLTDHLEHMQARRGARRFSTEICYTSPATNPYQELMRRWPGLPDKGSPTDHVIRFTPRDYETFRRMQPGDQYPQAYEIALGRLEAALRKEEKANGSRPREGGQRFEHIKRTVVPPYDPHKFPNKWRKIDPKAPARTIPAHIGKDSYSHIHYDSSQARMISVREAARLQSFPDSFRFAGSMNQAFRQIGNSVPPLMAYAVAASVMRQLASAGILSQRKTLPLNGISALLTEVN